MSYQGAQIASCRPEVDEKGLAFFGSELTGLTAVEALESSACYEFITRGRGLDIDSNQVGVGVDAREHLALDLGFELFRTLGLGGGNSPSDEQLRLLLIEAAFQ